MGIVALSSPFDDEAFEGGLARLRAMDLVPVVPDAIRQRTGYLAGSDDHRVRMLHELYADPSIGAVICARGGYGAMRILDRIDGRLIRTHPKLFVGFSDVTALLNHMYQAWGVVAFHGPVVCSLDRSDQDSIDALEALLIDGNAGGFDLPAAGILVPGRAEGPLMGGNLTTICHLIGTPFQPDFRGAILMLEDVNEPLYKLDRMLTQMIQAGVLDDVQGMVLGEFVDCGDVREQAVFFQEILAPLGIPLAMGTAFGHGRTNRIFPIGATARLDTDSGSLVL
ncbi:LD-carboxypeptidase [Desulfatiferula olefinivorans]